MTQPTLAQRLHGLAATLLILLLVAGVPFLLIAIGAAPWKADLGELPTLLTSPDDGTLAMVVIAAVAWIAWAFVAVSTVATLASLGKASYWVLVVGGLAIGLAQSPSQPARASLVMDLVGRHNISNANALNSMALNMTQVVGPAVGKRRRIMKPTCSFSALPVPTTAFFTTLAAYSATGRPARAGTSRAMARAWPSFSALWALLFMKVSSTAASTGRWASMIRLISSNRHNSRSAKGRVSFGATTPCAT